MRRKTGHFSVQQGKKVWVFLQDDTKFLAKFKEFSGRYIEFYDHDRVLPEYVRTLTLARGNYAPRTSPTTS